MRMLASAGLPVMTDGRRDPDDDNPDGYFEWEAIRKIGTRPEILHDAAGKVIKVISMLLPSLPLRHQYKVIFMDRPVEEVAASQLKMIQRRGATPPNASPGKMAQMLRDHRDQILRGLSMAKGFEVLVVDYPGLVRSPGEWVPRIEAFLGALPAPAAMHGVIRPELYRNRS